MGILNSARTMAGNAWNATKEAMGTGWTGAKATAGWGLTVGTIAGAAKWGAMSPMGRMGTMAGAGALYGGTIGRNPGQSRFEGAINNAASAAVLYGAGRYGLAGAKSFQAARAQGRQGRDAFSAFSRGAFRRAARDALAAKRYIGNSPLRSNRGVGKIKAL